MDGQLIEEEVRVQQEAALRGRPSKYPLEDQRDAVATVLDEHRNIAEVACSSGVNEGPLGNWVGKAAPNA